MKYTIYSDGSDFKHTTHRLGVGAVLIDQNDKLIDKVQKEYNAMYMQIAYKTNDCSNPTMEMLAAFEALKAFQDYFKPSDEITLKADYMGVSKWMDPEKPWAINKPYIQKIKSKIDLIIKEKNLNIKFEWVKGHQSVMSKDSHWNNIVDKLSKGENYDDKN